MSIESENGKIFTFSLSTPLLPKLSHFLKFSRKSFEELQIIFSKRISGKSSKNEKSLGGGMENENGGFFKFPFSISLKIYDFFNFCRNSFYKWAGCEVKQCQFYSL